MELRPLCEVASEAVTNFGSGSSIIVAPIWRKGYEIFRHVEDIFRSGICNVAVVPIMPSCQESGDIYRPMRGFIQSVDTPDSIVDGSIIKPMFRYDYAVIVDDGSMTGDTLAGAGFYCLRHRANLGFDKLKTFIGYVDATGASDFYGFKFETGRTMRSFLRERAPDEYEKLRLSGDLDALQPEDKHLINHKLLREAKAYFEQLLPVGIGINYHGLVRDVSREASRLRAVLEGEPLKVLTIGGRAEEDFAILNKFLRAEGIDATGYEAHVSREREGEITPLAEVPKEIYGGKGKLLLFNDRIRGGTRTAGAVVWALDNAEKLGLRDKDVYVAAVQDKKGLADFAVVREHPYAGVEVLREIAPYTCRRLEAEGKLRYLGGLQEGLKTLRRRPTTLEVLARVNEDMIPNSDHYIATLARRDHLSMGDESKALEALAGV